MRTLLGITGALSLMGVSFSSHAAENCPQVASIKQVGTGVYRAMGERGQWSGVLQGVETAPVQSFEMALAIPDHEMATQQFQYCSYNVGFRIELDMLFLPDNDKEYTVITEGEVWRKEPGHFGLIYNVCEKTAPENCKFSLVQ